MCVESTHMVLFLLLASIYVECAVLTKKEFISAVTINRYPIPKDEVYQHLANNTRNFTRREIAMFIAQLIHESGGFKYTEQFDCIKHRCEGQYDDGAGLQNKSYHGRGYIQLTWAANYRVASLGLGMGRTLLEHPELVAEDTRLAVLVSVWYWRTRVRPLLKGREDWFGLTTKGINPGECPKVKYVAKRRYCIYLKVAQVLKIKEKAKENGCYS